MFSTPNSVRSPVLGGVTASSTGGFLSSSSISHFLMGFKFTGLLLSIGVFRGSSGRSA